MAGTIKFTLTDDTTGVHEVEITLNDKRMHRFMTFVQAAYPTRVTSAGELKANTLTAAVKTCFRMSFRGWVNSGNEILKQEAFKATEDAFVNELDEDPEIVEPVEPE